MANINSLTLPKLSKQGHKIKPNKIATANLPPKPYTEYTIFFRLERAHILQSSGLIDEEVLASLDPNHCDAVEFPRPPKYEQLALPPYWYSSSHKAAIEKKRKHRKREGRMDLKTLSKTISASWRNADPVAVEYCRKLSKAELEKYNTAIEVITEKCKAEKKKKAPDVNTSSGGQQHQQQPNSNSKFVVPEVPSSSSQASALALTFQDFVIAANQQIENPVTTTMMPVVTPPISEVNMQNMNSFNGIVDSGNNNCADPQINLKDQALLQMLQLQAAQQQNMSLRGNNSPTSVPSSASPYANLPKYKRKFVRRPSAPAEYLHKEMDSTTTQPYMGTNENIVSESHIGSGTFVVNTFLGDDTNSAPKKQMSRRSSMTCMASHQVNELEEMRAVATNQSVPKLKFVRRRASTESLSRQGLSASFKKELENGSFTCVPEWEKKDADALLDMLNAPQASEPVATFNNDLPSSMDQELLEFMKNVGF